MHHRIPDHGSIISANLYGLILTTPDLARRLIPQGLSPSPYEVLDYTTTAVIHDQQGMHVTLERQERIRFLQEGVSAILDHAWGNGVVLTSYQTDVGEIEGMLRDDDKRHLIIGLDRRMHKGEILEFRIVRELVGAVTGQHEWLEAVIDHPVRQLGCSVVFPADRPCQHAVLCFGMSEVVIPIIKDSNGLTMAHFHLPLPQPHHSYTLKWTW